MTTAEHIRRCLLRVPPSDRTVLVLLALAVAVATSRLSALGPSILPLLELHAVLFAGFLAFVVAAARWERWPGIPFLRAAVTVGVIFTCYTSLGRLGVVGIPYNADAALSEVDTWLFGTDPSLYLQRFLTPVRVECFSFVYGAFIPYIYLSLALGCLGRPPVERDQFLTGWVFTYAISYLGYIFVPAHGPVLYHAADYTVPLQGGWFYRAVVAGMEASGGFQGVFPSLHVGGSVYLCLFDLQTHRLRGLTYLPMVLLIYVATLVLRYHYVIDLIAGTAVALSCIPLGHHAFNQWMRRREAAGLPAQPGGESDALLPVPGAGAADAARLLPAD